MEFQAFPKVELHVHLDCSLSFRVVSRIDPAITQPEYNSSFIAPPKCIDLADYLIRTEASIALMQTRQHLKWVTEDLIDQLAEDNVLYAEIRFAPLQHTRQGLTPKEVVETVIETITNYDIPQKPQLGLILCTLRHHTEQQSLETAQLAIECSRTFPTGFDIAADEAKFPLQPHYKAFQLALQHGLTLTAHAGEAKGPESVKETIQHLKVRRIGHGVRSIEDPNLVAYLARNKIHLEICPSSNVQTNVFSSLADHSVDELRKAGVCLSINTDGRSLVNTTLTQEYQRLHQHFGWTATDFLACNLQAVEASLLPRTEKIRLCHQLLGQARSFLYA
jgi:adenosine deaminase